MARGYISPIWLRGSHKEKRPLPSSQTPLMEYPTDKEYCYTNIYLARSWRCLMPNISLEKNRLSQFASSFRHSQGCAEFMTTKLASNLFRTPVPSTYAFPGYNVRTTSPQQTQAGPTMPSANHLYPRVKPPFTVMTWFTGDAGHKCRREN